MHLPSGRNVHRPPAIAPERDRTEVCQCKQTDLRSVRGEETDLLFILVMNSDWSPPLGSPIPPQLETPPRAHIYPLDPPKESSIYGQKMAWSLKGQILSGLKWLMFGDFCYSNLGNIMNISKYTLTFAKYIFGCM